VTPPPNLLPWIVHIRADGPAHAIVDAGKLVAGRPLWLITACGVYDFGGVNAVAELNPAARATCRSCLRRIAVTSAADAKIGA
jgi:hypothetical protein